MGNTSVEETGDSPKSCKLKLMNPQQKMDVIRTMAKLNDSPKKMYLSNDKNTVCFASHLRGHDDCNVTNQLHKRPFLLHNSIQGSDSCNDSAASKKLKVKGLKTFMEKRNYGAPPSWVKDFPCKSRFHPDAYLFDHEESPFNPRRNVHALSQCKNRGGRCYKCGISCISICQQCNLCPIDCTCPKEPSQTEILGQIGLPMDSFKNTLSAAQKILDSSHNAPTQYPFRSSEINTGKISSSNSISPMSQPNHQFVPVQYPPALGYPHFQPQTAYPFGVQPPPICYYPSQPTLPYQIPTPPIPAYFNPTPMSYPLPQYPAFGMVQHYPLPYQQNSVPTPLEPKYQGYISVNNDK